MTYVTLKLTVKLNFQNLKSSNEFKFQKQQIQLMKNEKNIKTIIRKNTKKKSSLCYGDIKACLIKKC